MTEHSLRNLVNWPLTFWRKNCNACYSCYWDTVQQIQTFWDGLFSSYKRTRNRQTDGQTNVLQRDMESPYRRPHNNISYVLEQRWHIYGRYGCAPAASINVTRGEVSHGEETYGTPVSRVLSCAASSSKRTCISTRFEQQTNKATNNRTVK